jgi:hypothetical protein
MGGTNERIRRRRYRRRLRRDSRGVVSVIGTFLALLVFFALFGVFLTQYLPLWMTEDEQQLSAQVQASMAQMKANVDSQVTQGNPPVYSTPFPTTSQSVPLLSQPTAATITFVPFTVGVFANVSMTPQPGGFPGTYYQNQSLGRLLVQQPDRYYSPQTFSFEDDAVVQSQSASQQVVAYPPILSFNQSGVVYGVTVSLLQLVGPAAQSVGTGTQEVNSHYLFSQVVQGYSAARTQAATFAIGTPYPCAWESFLNSQLSSSNLTHYTLTGPACPTGLLAPQIVKVTFTNLTWFTFVFSEIRMVIGVGVE